ncbi:ATP-binding protein [Aureimonas populi]|uniref:histidine kinase n=1 Tax=Aureimonas populi TaxID=1701758 RepID=A0ABW5CLT6_9HYPH|nr:ATP-binding protein [Aureimonas populi]
MKILSAAPRTIRGQFIVLLMLALTVVQCVSIALFIHERQRSILAALAKDGVSRIASVAGAVDAAPDGAIASILRSAESIDFRLSVDGAPLTDADGADALDYLSGHIQSALASVPDRSVGVALIDNEVASSPRPGPDGDEDGDPTHLAISTELRNGSWLNARVDTGGPPLQWAWPAFVSILLTMAAVIATVWLLVGRVSRPMRRLAENAERLGRGAAIEPLDSTGPDEIRRLTTTFEEMAQRLTKLLSERSNMLAALGHDLRSPITAMRLRLEMVDDEETRERMNNCLDEMQTLVESALALARGADTGEPVTVVNLGRMLRTLAEEMQEAGGDISISLEGDLNVKARRTSLKRALRNIAENAMRYGEEARITLQSANDVALIIVEDNGPGIPGHERERVFEPFVRLEASRSRDTGGSGLGLAIAKVAVEANGGSVRAEDACTGGARLVVSLPAVHS